jgi:hypothetical protein
LTRRKGSHEADLTGPSRAARPGHPAAHADRPEAVARRGDGHQALAGRRCHAAVAGRRAGRLVPAQADPHREHGRSSRVHDPLADDDRGRYPSHAGAVLRGEPRGAGRLRDSAGGAWPHRLLGRELRGAASPGHPGRAAHSQRAGDDPGDGHRIPRRPVLGPGRRCCAACTAGRPSRLSRRGTNRARTVRTPSSPDPVPTAERTRFHALAGSVARGSCVRGPRSEPPDPRFVPPTAACGHRPYPFRGIETWSVRSGRKMRPPARRACHPARPGRRSSR